MRIDPKISLMLLAISLSTTNCAARAGLQTETSSSAIRSAEELGAADVPQAALHLQLANEELAAAKTMNEDRRPNEAASMLLRAEADAELAIALSRADADREAAKAAVQRVRTLQIENPYSPGGTK